MKKLLIASGCSFTEKDFVSTHHPEMDCTWDKWPELLAEKLNMNCINLGSRGAGNEYIYNSIVEQVIKTKNNKIGLNEISMGMTNDYLKALEYKTTFLRIGSAIFGSRN